MKQVYKAGHPAAWIGDSAPIPEGWHLDLQSAIDAEKPQEKEQGNGLHEEETRNAEEVTEPRMKRKYTRRM